jgi:hypothetical protein
MNWGARRCRSYGELIRYADDTRAVFKIGPAGDLRGNDLGGADVVL